MINHLSDLVCELLTVIRQFSVNAPSDHPVQVLSCPFLRMQGIPNYPCKSLQLAACGQYHANSESIIACAF